MRKCKGVCAVTDEKMARNARFLPPCAHSFEFGVFKQS